MTAIRDIIAHLETIAPPSYQENYDNAGLIVGDAERPFEKALLCLDSTEEVVDEAIEKGCNLVIAHHPIVFKGLKKFNGKNYIERTVMKAIKHDIAIYACHTNLDNVHNGVSAKICEAIGLVNCEILKPKTGLLKKLFTYIPLESVESVRGAIFDAGAGVIGEYDRCSFNVEGYGTFRGSDASNPTVGEIGSLHKEPEVKVEMVFPSIIQSRVIAALTKAHPYEEVAYDVVSLDNAFARVGAGMVGELESEMDELEFLQMIKSKMQTDCVRYTGLLEREVKRVAVCGGSGSFLLRDAIRAGADVFITADFKYHQFFDADGKIVIADIGHFESEQFTINLFHEILTQKFHTFAFLFSKTNTNPIKYL